jgi:hypothetical protein
MFGLMVRPHRGTPGAEALFHLAVIDEMMSGVGIDPSIQYVEINMLSTSQQFVTDSHLSYFAGDGSAVEVLLIVPGDVMSGNNRRWIMAADDEPASSAELGDEFEAASGIFPDFTWDPSVTGDIDPTSGMICWGAPGTSVPDPGDWDENDPTLYVDCIAYGGYGGDPEVPPVGSTTGLGPGDGARALQRMNNNQPGAFAYACATPQNNDNQVGSLADADADGFCDPVDNCPAVANAGQQNTDSAIGNSIGIPDEDKSVPRSVADTDGDACEADGDIDNDVLPDADDGGILAGCGAFDGMAAGHANPGGGDITSADGNPPSFDTDGDQVTDGRECAVGTNPRTGAAADRTACNTAVGTATMDTDLDGLQDGWEYCKWGTLHTGVGSTNSDGDAVADCREAIDVNGNNSLTNGDATFVQQAFFGIIGSDWIFDINGNGALTNGDATFVRQAFFGINPCL